MIAQFPDPYPDELLYSVLARYVNRMQFPTVSAAALELLGRRHAVPAVELPNAIDFLVNQLPPGHRYTSDCLIQKHTLFPVFAPFLPERSATAIRRNMKAGDGRTTIVRSGIAAGGVQPTLFFRICPKCDEASMDSYGEIYWHRLHQVPGVEVCPRHRVFLQTTDARKRSQKNRHSFLVAGHASRDTKIFNVNADDPKHVLLLKLAESVEWLLEQSDIAHRGRELMENYRRRLRNKNFITSGGRVNLAKLRDAVNDFWSPTLLKRLQCEIPNNGEMGWLGRLTRSKRDRAIAPIRHLVLMTFLGSSVEELFRGEMPHAVQEGPFNCMNPICEYRNEPVIEQFLEKNNNYTTIFVFTCPHCGHVSSRPRHGCHIQRMLDYGPVWKERLRQLWGARHVSLFAAGKLLGADITTLKRYALKVGLPFPRVGPRRIEQGTVRLFQPWRPSIDTVAAKRALWLSFLTSHPGIGRKEARLKNLAVHSWLHRNDWEWLRLNLSAKKVRSSNFQRVDWFARDKQIADQVAEVAQHWRNLPDKPRRVTVTAVGRELGIVALLSKNIHKLPRTRVVLAKVTETGFQFASRRIAFAEQQLILRGEIPTFSDLMRVAGIGASTRKVAGVESALRDSIKMIHQKVDSAVNLA